MKKSEILHLETRRVIYNYIRDNPGLHLRELSRRLNLTYYNANYHINYLKKLGMVSIKSDNSYSRIYAVNQIGSNEKNILNIMRQKTPRRILIFMCISVVASQQEISESLEKHKTTIEFHLKKFLENDILEPAEYRNGLAITNHPSGRNLERKTKHNENLYRIKDYNLVKKLFISHKKSLFKDKFFKSAFWYISHVSKVYGPDVRKRTKNMKTFDDRWEVFLERAYDIFPHPYHA
jgi:DNA-binding transcriptional ArsR family regulator